MCLWGGQGFAIGKQFLGCLIEPPRGKHLKTSEHTGSARGEVSKFKTRCPLRLSLLDATGTPKFRLIAKLFPVVALPSTAVFCLQRTLRCVLFSLTTVEP